VTVTLPPLRARKEDTPLLAGHFLRHFSEQFNRPVRNLSPEVTQLFLTYGWPGNVRELQNVIQHAVLLAETDSVQVSDLSEYLQAEFPKDTSFQSLRERQAETVEKTFLLDLLAKHKGNVSEAAAEAKMTRKMIYRLTGKFGIDLAQFRQETR